MDFETPTTAWIHEEFTEPKPEAVFEMMEIMLPDARYIPEVGRGRLLELWAKKSQTRRSGWISIHEQKLSLSEAQEQDDNMAESDVKIGLEGTTDSIVEKALETDEIASSAYAPEPLVSGRSTPNSLEDLDESALEALVSNDMDVDE